MRTISFRLKNKLDEVYQIEPNNLGVSFLTLIYKRITQPLKRFPFLTLVPLAFILAFIAYLLLGSLLVKLVTVLQYGF